MNRKPLRLPLLTCLLAASLLRAQPVTARPPASVGVDLHAQALALAPSLRQVANLDGQHGFEVRDLHTDEFGISHARYRHTFRGVPVWGSEAISHFDAQGRVQSHSLALHPPTDLVTEPSLTQSEALALAHRDLSPRGAYARRPLTELMIYPVLEQRFRPRSSEEAALGPDRAPAGAFVREVVRHVLAYHVHTELENGAEETKHVDYMIDAHTGGQLAKWSSLMTDAEPVTPSPDIIFFNPWWFGNGDSEYSGMVWISTLKHMRSLPMPWGGVYTLTWYTSEDSTRGVGGMFGHNATTNLDHGTSGSGTLYSTDTDQWGDGHNYTSGDTTAGTGQTAAVDAQFGLQTTWDMYAKVFGRNGIDGKGTATYSRVHYGTGFNNAFWNDGCFCMSYGDGDMITQKAPVALDAAGHELTHGVCTSTANLPHSQEGGALNEANSDIFGAMATFWARGTGGLGSVIPNTGGSWLHGDQYMLSPNHFLRCMYKPSKDGQSQDSWFSGLWSLEVHIGSGPMNRCFYFLSQGASSSPTSDTYSSFLPAGMTGIGNDKAARIWYRALTTQLTAGSVYLDARKGALQAAADLYGASSAEVQAVDMAFRAINVY